MNPSRRRTRGAAAALCLVTATATSAALLAQPPGAAHAAPHTGNGGLYTPVVPDRVYDTRASGGALSAGHTRRVQVTGVAGVPRAGVLAIVANVTAVTPTASGFFTVAPAGTPRPPTSNLNFLAAQTVANLVTVGVSADGGIDVYNHSGAAHLLVDVTGYYATADGPAGSRFTATGPTRALDREIAAGAPVDVAVAGSYGVPADASAVALNVGVTAPTASSHVTVAPTGGTSRVSTLNFRERATASNQTVVPVGTRGSVTVTNHSGQVRVTLDVLGYYSATGARFYPLPPRRWLDTRSAPLANGSTTKVRTSAGAHAVVANITATASRSAGHVAVHHPSATALPTIRFAAGQTVPNLVVVGVDADGAFAVTNAAEATGVIVDVMGEFHADGSEPSGALPPSPTPAPTGDVQPAFPIRAAFYYPWYTTTPKSRFRPTPNPYNVDDPAFLAQQVRVMRYAGMNAGISHWGMNYLEDQRFPRLLRAADGTAFRWSIQYQPEGATDGTQPTVAKIRNDLQYIKGKYGADRNYLRVGGKPVVFVWTDASDGCAMVQRWRDANATVGFYVVLKRFTGFLSCPAQPSSWHQYAPAGRVADVKPYAFSVSPGFYSAWEASPRLARDTAAFATAVQQMIASRAQWQLVTTFNEWGEGTAVESAYEWRSASGSGAYVDILHRYLGTTR